MTDTQDLSPKICGELSEAEALTVQPLAAPALTFKSILSTASTNMLVPWSTMSPDFAKYDVAPSPINFSSFDCGRLVRTMTGVQAVSAFLRNARSTSGPES